MPTRAEQEELSNNCTWTWTTQNGVNGYKVTSKTNDNYIFLPAAGYGYGPTHGCVGENGIYWSSTPYDDSHANNSYSLGFSSVSHYVDWFTRTSGRSVRPVSE